MSPMHSMMIQAVVTDDELNRLIGLQYDRLMKTTRNPILKKLKNNGLMSVRNLNYNGPNLADSGLNLVNSGQN